MKKQASILLYFILISGLAACNLPVVSEPADSGDEIALQYQTVSALLTATAAWEPGAEVVQTAHPGTLQSPSNTVVAVVMTTAERPTSISTRVAGESSLKPLNESCDRAQAGRPIDVTIPDDTHFYPGEYFSKTWRLENVGTCRWTRDYSVVWFSGDELGVIRAQSFSANVEAGRVVDVTVDMVAPKQPGTYQSNWKLRSEDGRLFGIGPNGDSPFWVRIVVVPVSTPTMTPTIPISTPTRAPVILLRGSVELLLDESLELDLDPEKEDLFFQLSEEGELLLASINGAKLALIGPNAPRYEDCLIAPVQDVVVTLGADLNDNYYCYRTSDGLPGRLFLSHIDAVNNQLGLEYTTWAIP